MQTSLAQSDRVYIRSRCVPKMSLWRMGLGLAFSVAYGAGMILALITPGLQPMFVLVPALVAIAASIALNIAARGPRWWRSDSEDRRIYKDEWVKEITN